MNNNLALIVNQSGLETSKAQILLNNFQNYFEIAADWEQKAKMLVVTDSSQKAEMKMAKEGRLFLKEKRVNVEKTRKELKEQSLREGQTIDAIAKILKNLIEPIEQHLEQQEKFIEIQEAKFKAERKEVRINILTELEFDFKYTDLLNMPDIDFDSLVLKLANERDIKIANEKKAEEERLAKIEAEKIENERIRLENKKLREQQEIERKKQEEILAKQKAEFEEKMRLEKIERERIENELKQKAIEELTIKEEQEKKLREQQEIEMKKATAPDKEKLLLFIESLTNIVYPNMATDNYKQKVNFAKKKINELVGILQ